MVVSMTGYGRGEARAGGLAVAVEIKSVNHRHLEAAVSLPPGFWVLESRLKEGLRRVLRRGRVDLYLHLLTPVPGVREPVVDVALAGRYLAALRAARARLGLAGRPDLDLVAGLPEVVRLETRPVSTERLGPVVDQALNRALMRLQAMRRAEGRRLGADIRGRLQTIARGVGELRRRGQANLRRQAQALRRQLAAARNIAAEGKRPAPEAPAQTGRSDVTEELVRLRSHLAQFSRFLRLRQPVGRRLDFLLQEMNREINTVGSKCGDAPMAHRVVTLKEEMEKVREQVQNLE